MLHLNFLRSDRHLYDHAGARNSEDVGDINESDKPQTQRIPAAAFPAHDRGEMMYFDEPPSQSGAVNPCAKSPVVSVVMPVFNEMPTLAEIIAKVLAQPCVAELIAVDDCSTDTSWNVLQRISQESHRLVLHRHETNRGKGAALRTGFAAASSPIVVVQDADLEYDPAEYSKIVQPILDGKADVVFGSRFIGSEVHRVLYFWHSVGNRFLTLVSNMATNINLTDMESGFKAFRRETLAKIDLKEDRFGFEPEITAKVARTGARIYEVAISYYGRTYAEGKKIGWRDGVHALFCILKYNLLS